VDKYYISAEQLLQDAFELGLVIVSSGFKPDFIIGVWRGGTPVAIAVQEVMNFVGISSDHFAIRTSSYTGINERTEVKVQGLDYLSGKLNEAHSLLLIDDVFDTGYSLQQVLSELDLICNKKPPQVKIATPYFKPLNNKTARIPDYYLHTTSKWLVFPHELQGLEDTEIIYAKPGSKGLMQRLCKLRESIKNNT